MTALKCQCCGTRVLLLLKDVTVPGATIALHLKVLDQEHPLSHMNYLPLAVGKVTYRHGEACLHFSTTQIAC